MRFVASGGVAGALQMSGSPGPGGGGAPDERRVALRSRLSLWGMTPIEGQPRLKGSVTVHSPANEGEG